MEWTGIPRRLLRSPRTKKLRHAYRAVWQGQVLHSGNGGAAICKCGHKEPCSMSCMNAPGPRSTGSVRLRCLSAEDFRTSVSGCGAWSLPAGRVSPIRLRSANLRKQAFFWKARRVLPGSRYRCKWWPTYQGSPPQGSGLSGGHRAAEGSPS